MNAIAVFGAPSRPGALSILVEFQRGVVHTEPDERERTSERTASRRDRDRGRLAVAHHRDRLDGGAGIRPLGSPALIEDAGCGLRRRPCGLLVSSITGRRCRWLAPWCQVAVCLIWNWCLRFLVAALLRWLLEPLARFASQHRWGIAGWTAAGLSLWLVATHGDWISYLIWGAAAGPLLGFWAWWRWPALRTPERLS